MPIQQNRPLGARVSVNPNVEIRASEGLELNLDLDSRAKTKP